MIRKLSALLLAALLLCGCAAAEGTSGTITPLPIDFTPGYAPQEDGFDPVALAYEDPSISVSISSGRRDGCDWWVATIRIADASQLRTLSAGGFDSTSATAKGVNLAKQANAVLAINGDYFCYNKDEGLTIRQGTVYKNLLKGNRDVLAIDANGDFHCYFCPNEDEVPTEVDGVPVVNAFYFGPVLVYEGKLIEKLNFNAFTSRVMVAGEKRQRMAICQSGPLEYKVVCCAAPARGNKGMTLDQFGQLVVEQGVQTAYNLDGGDSTMLIFNYKKQNDVTSRDTRKIVDIIYFASAWNTEGE